MANLPEPIVEFFRLKNAEDDEALALLFSEDATFIDAGPSSRGTRIDRSERGLPVTEFAPGLHARGKTWTPPLTIVMWAAGHDSLCLA